MTACERASCVRGYAEGNKPRTRTGTHKRIAVFFIVLHGDLSERRAEDLNAGGVVVFRKLEYEKKTVSLLL